MHHTRKVQVHLHAMLASRRHQVTLGWWRDPTAVHGALVASVSMTIQASAECALLCNISMHAIYISSGRGARKRSLQKYSCDRTALDLECAADRRVGQPQAGDECFCAFKFGPWWMIAFNL